MGQTIGPSSGLVGAGGSAVAPGVPVEGGGSTVVSHELIGVGRSATTPEVLTERGGSTAAPSKAREMSPSVWEQGQAQDSPARMSWSRKPGVRPQNIPTAQQH